MNGLRECNEFFIKNCEGGDKHMDANELKEAAEFIYQDLRLRTLPIATKFLEDELQWPEKTRRPSEDMGKRISLCQAMTLARIYRMNVGVT